MNILVLCTGNSARSILLESIFNTLGKDRVTAFSAGSQPAGKVHPQSIKLLTELGHDVSGARSKSWDEFGGPDAPRMDIVITVCASAAGETCPVWAGAPVRCHWGVEDPAAAEEPEWDEAFKTAYTILKKRAEALLEVKFENLELPALTAELKRIGELV
ncbi:arsenate reductase ArsC [Epibacterium sp. SM1979]|uniref:Arsenate reductase ArsC n=1 Tax=Tritonibacter litoralis TaxID=2662264 RepID=A0A843YCH0_9RHOB|nr:arsenate reductase ArsC [Tritonibacter litoralis]MQQ07174.1 arsenate reductase ArsC [Tritonibacter litoralis]